MSESGRLSSERKSGWVFEGMWESRMEGKNGVFEKEREEGEGKDSGELWVGTEVRYYLMELV